MGSSESFGAEAGRGAEVVAWINDHARQKRWKLEARLYGHVIHTKNFGDFEMFSWVGDVRSARRALVLASRRYKARVIEGGYKAKERVLSTHRSEYALVKMGDRVLGRLELEAPRLGRRPWALRREEAC